MIRNRIHVPHYNASNNSHIVLRSASLSEIALAGLVEKFRIVDKWNLYSHEKLVSDEACVPTSGNFKRASRYVEGGSMFQPQDWNEISISDESFRPPSIPPRHIRSIPVPASLKGGMWAVDLDIGRAVDLSRYQNIQHHWRLPRRLRMAKAFTPGYQASAHGPICMPRTTLEGLLSLYAQVSGLLPEIHSPSDETVFNVALCRPPEWMPFSSNQKSNPSSIACDIRPSDKGRYLKALLRLSDGIHRGKQIFLHKFWKSQFESLGATTAAIDGRVPEVVGTLKKRLKAGKIETQEEWERVAGVVLSQARAIRLPTRFLRYDQLAKIFETFRDDYWAEHDAVAPREEWDDDEKRSLSDSTQYLCQRGILHQGHEWLCRHCANNNWVSLETFRASLICEVCGASQPAPVAEPWHFRLNNFVGGGLREHGLLASLWCLARLADQANASFFFLEPHEIFFSAASADARKPDAEMDLLTVSDGVVRLCEAKTSSKKIDLQKFADLARKIRPNFATLAVMEQRSPALIQKLSELKTALDGSDIEAELITLMPDDIDDSPHLPTGQSFVVRLL